MKREQLYKLEQAEEILNNLYWEIRNEEECAREAERLDTIINKLFDLGFWCRAKLDYKEMKGE